MSSRHAVRNCGRSSWGSPLWGSQLAPDDRVDPASARAELIALTLAAQIPREASAGLHETYEFRVGDEHFHIALDDGEAAARSGASPREPAVVVDCDLPTFARIAWGKLTPSQALSSGDARICRRAAGRHPRPAGTRRLTRRSGKVLPWRWSTGQSRRARKPIERENR